MTDAKAAAHVFLIGVSGGGEEVELKDRCSPGILF